jgi:hypothetical protein
LLEHNTIAKALSEYLAELVEASANRAAQKRGKEEADDPTDCQPVATPLSWLPGIRKIAP